MTSAWVLLLGFVAVGTGAGGPDGSTRPDMAEYEAARAAAGRDADAQVDLALWCEARGLMAEKARHLTRAVLIDPENARARGLLGQVKRDGRWMRPQDVARAEESPERQSLTSEYLGRRAKAADRADDQYRLALWCEEKGLTQAMVAHLHRTLQLDPGRDGAWRRLGFKKAGKRWVDPEVEALAKAEAEAQAKADKAWKPKLERIKDALASKSASRRDGALAELSEVVDPRAVPMIGQVLARGGDEARQKFAADAFGRIEGPGASQALATLAVFSPHAAIRADAAALLERRDPREYAGLLAALIRDEIKYKVKPVDGPGGQGELVLETRDASVRRLYSPSQAPMLMEGDQLGWDQDGRVVANRPLRRQVGAILTSNPLDAGAILTSPLPTAATFSPGPLIQDPVTGLPMVPPTVAAISAWANSPALQRPEVAAATLDSAGVSPGLSRTVAGRIHESNSLAVAMVGLASGVGGGMTLRPIIQESLQIPVQQMMAEAQASALQARRQLDADVAAIEAYNRPVREVNERSVAVLKSVSGEDRGDDRGRWMDWVLDLQGYGQPLRSESQPPATVVEQVPIDFQSRATPIITTGVAGYRIGPSCFAGGTPVRTLHGDRPIESIRPGDLVLSQDTTTGALSYRPVVEVFHNPPNLTHRIEAGGASVSPTGIHRFWKAGRGWVMARDVVPGDRLRTVGGVVEVTAAEKEKVQPVYNLLLSGGDNYCVGALGLIAHDNGFVGPVARPFDGVRAAAEVASAKP